MPILTHQESHELLHPYRTRYRKLKWYYRHRGRISLMITKPKSPNEEAEVLRDECLKSHLTGPDNWAQLFNQWAQKWLKQG